VPDGCARGGTGTGWRQGWELLGRVGQGGDGTAEPALGMKESGFAEPGQMCPASPPATFPPVATQLQHGGYLRLWPHQPHNFTYLGGAVGNAPPALQQCFRHS